MKLNLMVNEGFLKSEGSRTLIFTAGQRPVLWYLSLDLLGRGRLATYNFVGFVGKGTFGCVWLFLHHFCWEGDVWLLFTSRAVAES